MVPSLNGRGEASQGNALDLGGTDGAGDTIGADIATPLADEEDEDDGAAAACSCR